MGLSSRRPEPLGVHFAGNGAQVVCSDSLVRRCLARYFAHCQNGASAPGAAYEITGSASRGFILMRDGKPLLSGAGRDRVVLELIQDLTSRLIGPNQRQLLFHAGCLARKGRGVMLCGRTGAGKSTLAAWLADLGLGYLGEEVAAVDPVSGRMTGLPRCITLKGESAREWRERLIRRGRAPMELTAHGHLWIDPAQLGPGWMAAGAAARLVVFPRFAEKAPLRAEAMSSGAAAFELLQNLVNARNLADPLGATARLAQGTRACRLTYSSGREAAQWIDDAIKAPSTRP